MLPWGVTEFAHYPWYALSDLAGNLIAVIFVTASGTLLNTTGIEVTVHREADLERELNVEGIANMLSGAFGGHTGCISVSRSVLNFNAGGTGRLSWPRFRHRCWPLPRPCSATCLLTYFVSVIVERLTSAYRTNAILRRQHNDRSRRDDFFSDYGHSGSGRDAHKSAAAV